MRDPTRGVVPGADPRRLGGDYSVVSLCCLALAVALTLSVVGRISTTSLPFVAGLAGGFTLALAVRFLAADRTAAMVLGGLLAPLGTGAALAGVGLGVLRGGPVGAGTAVGGMALGLGAGLVVGQSFARDRPGRAASRHLVATVAVLSASCLAVLALAGPVNELFRAVDEVGSVITGLLGATSDPVPTAGPSLIVAATGLLAAADTLRQLPVPTFLTAETRTRARALAERWSGVLRPAGLVALILGLALVLVEATGGLAPLIDEGHLLRLAIGVVGSGVVRLGAVAFALLGVGSLAAVALAAWLRSVTLQHVAVATLPTVGLVAAGLVTAWALVSVPPFDLGSLPLGGRVLAGAGIETNGVGGATLIALSLLIGSTIAVTALSLLHRTLSGETPGVTLAAVGVAAVGFVAVAATPSTVAGFALFALALFVTDVGSYGRTIGAELGRRAGARAEVFHALASALVAVLGVAIARSLVGFASTSGPTLSVFHYAIGTVAIAVVLLTVGRQLSTR